MRIYRIASPTFYHGTDSEQFDEFDPSKAAKGDAYYNPLGQAMYATDKPEFAKMFGQNVYEVDIPDDAKIKRISPSQAESVVGDILKKALKRVGIDYWGTSITFKVDFNKLLSSARYSPYDAIMECVEYVGLEYPDLSKEYGEAVSQISTQKFSKFDVVKFIGTNNPNDIFIGETPTQEILIFNKEFQKVFNKL